MYTTLNILTTVKFYDKLLQKVKLDHYVHKLVAQNMKEVKKNLKRYDRFMLAMCLP